MEMILNKHELKPEDKLDLAAKKESKMCLIF